MIPDRIYAGDTVEFRVTVDDYPPADGWTLKYRLVPRFSAPTQTPITLTASVDGAEYVITDTPGNTAAWAPGMYGWARWVEKSGARQVLSDLQSHGQLEVLANPATAAQGADNRTQARKALDDALAARATFVASKATIAEYSIGDRRMKFNTAADFDVLISKLKVEVSREQRTKAMAAGLPDPRKLYVRAIRG